MASHAARVVALCHEAARDEGDMPARSRVRLEDVPGRAARLSWPAAAAEL